MLLLVYGTLRDGGALHDGYIGRGVKPQMTIDLEGWDMYDLGSYPYIAQGEGTIKAELYDITPSRVIETARMEMGAGYSVAEVETPLGKAPIFYYDEQRHTRARKGLRDIGKIESGDWISHHERSYV
jgi:gamma-glutamylcyclotransferase (GGCT)/AIG2-like uncharacterized protein YtfP